MASIISGCQPQEVRLYDSMFPNQACSIATPFTDCTS